MDKVDVIILERNQSSGLEVCEILRMHCPYANVVGLATNCEDTVALIESKNFELIVLGLSTGIDYAFEILKKASVDILKKKVVIINAENYQNSLTFFEASTGSPLTPIDPTTIIQAIYKAKQEMFQKIEVTKQIDYKKPLNLIAIPSVDEVKIIKITDVIYLESDGKYTRFYTLNNKQPILSSRNLGKYEEQLSDKNFLRIHNSYLINSEHVLEIQKKGGLYLKMNNNEFVPVSKRKKEVIFKFLGLKN